MVPRLGLASLILAAMAFGLASSGQEAAPKSEAKQLKESLSVKEQILARQYQEFEQQLLRLKQRMERSPKQEDRDRALVLDKVLEYCKERSLSVQFEQMVDLLKSKELKSLPDIKQALERSTQIADELRTVITMLREDTRAKILRDERQRLEALLKELERVIHDQKAVEGLTQNKKTDKDELKNIQNKVTKATGDLAQKLAGKDGSGDKNSKGDPKSAGKNGSQAAKAKGDGETPKAEAKAGGEPKEPKSASKSPGDSGQKKEDGPGQAKGDPGKKGGESQAKTGKAGEPGKAGDPKAASKSGSESQPGQKAQAKAGKSSSGQSQAKAAGPKSPQNPNSEEKQASNKSGDGKKQGSPSPKETPPTGKKQVEDAEYKQKEAEAKIEQEKNDEASDKQNAAIRDLEKAKKDLEKLLRQIREEEVERLLAALQARCEKMLAMQLQVLYGTEQVDKAVASNEDKKPSRMDKQQSLKLSDQEGDIVVEATKAIEMLEAEGSAVAFPEVFYQVREDMKHVQRRLGVTDVSQVTQAIERDIVDTLKEMVEALKKKRQEAGQSKSSDSPPPGSQDQKLLDKIAELKMIRSLQIRVNGRTQTYGKMYQGEQANEPNIRRELHDLSDRQERIFEITNRMAKGDNR